jgi:acyl transferase domain-containing protein
VALEEPPPPPKPAPAGRAWQLLVISARSATALTAAAARLADHLEAHPELHLPDVAWTLAIGRRAFEHRLAVLCRDVWEAVTALRSGGPERLATGVAARRNRPVALFLPGEPGPPEIAALYHEDSAAALAKLGRLWIAGAEIDWAALHAGERRLRVPLPTYPFERRRYWMQSEMTENGIEAPRPTPRVPRGVDGEPSVNAET